LARAAGQLARPLPARAGGDPRGRNGAAHRGHPGGARAPGAAAARRRGGRAEPARVLADRRQGRGAVRRYTPAATLRGVTAGAAKAANPANAAAPPFPALAGLAALAGARVRQRDSAPPPCDPTALLRFTLEAHAALAAREPDAIERE